MPERGADEGLIADERAEVEIIDSKLVFEGRVWDVRYDVFDYNGHELRRDYIDHTGAVAVVALDEDDRMLVIQQYRHPIRYRDWELPAGLLDVEGEDPLLAAQRELAEEADLVATDWSVLSEFWTTPGGSNEAIRLYLARGLSATPEAFARSEEEADIVKRWVPLDEVVDGVLARRLQNPPLTIGALAAHASRARGWASLGAPEEPWSRHPRLR